MTEVHYGVVKMNDGWSIIGHGLRYGPYRRRADAVVAAQRLAAKSAGLPVHLHLQSPEGELKRAPGPGDGH